MIKEQIQEKELMLYEDDIAVAMLAKNAASKGHIVIVPKKEAKYVEELDEEELEHIFYLASYSATVLFETMGAQGTNIIVSEGEELRFDVIARGPDDGLNFQWKPKQITQVEMDEAKSAIAGKIVIGNEEKAQDKPEKPPKVEDQPGDKQENPDEDYRIKQLHRIP